MWRRFLAWLLGGWQQLLYLGFTGRTAVARWAEHAADKSWARDVAVWERDPRVYYSEAEVRAAERERIIAERPVHNVEHNGNNPGAVRIRRHLPQHVVRARLRLAARAGLWLAVFAWLWIAGAGVWPGWDAPRNAAVGASVVVVGVRVGRWLSGGRSRRRPRRGRRR